MKIDSTNMPKVSIIVPIFNSMPYLSECLESLINQSYQNLEIILVNDGSTDESEVIALEYAKKDSRICYFSQNNQGAAVARNYGLDKANGEYVLFFDSDDYMALDAIETLLHRALKADSQITIAASRAYSQTHQTFSDMSWALRFDLLPESALKATNATFCYKDFPRYIYGFCVGWAWDKLYKKDFVMFHQLRFQPQGATDDLYFVFVSLVLAHRISVCDKVLFTHRTQVPTSLENSRDKYPLVFLEALRAWQDKLKDLEIYAQVEQSVINWSLDFCLWHLDTLGKKGHYKLFGVLKTALKELGIAQKDRAYFENQAAFNKMRYILCVPLWLHRFNVLRILAFKELFCVRIRPIKKEYKIVLFGKVLVDFKRN